MSSQYGQDYFVLNVLGGMRNGFFLDSGASDGVGVSNTQLLEKFYGWHGICVEPNVQFFDKLVRNRQCHCVNYCLYDREGTVEFVEANTIGGILNEYDSTLLKHAATMFEVPDGGTPPTVERQCRTVRSVLKEHDAPQIIDYWSLDTEGSELTILKSFPFDEFAFRVLTVEHNWLPARNEIMAFLNTYGYRWIVEMGCDDGYVHSALSPRPAWMSRAWARRKITNRI